MGSMPEFAFGRKGCRAALGLMVTVITAAPEVAHPAASIELLSGGSATATVAPGLVTLRLDARITSSDPISALQLGLLASNPELFEFDANPWTHGSPFTADETATGAPPIEGELLSSDPVIAYFRFSGDDYPPSSFPAIVFSLAIRSRISLPEGTYTFEIGDQGGEFFYLNSSSLDALPFDSSAAFTLTVASDSGGGSGGGGGTSGGGGTGGGDTGGGGTDGGSGGTDGGGSTDGGTPDGGGTGGNTNGGGTDSGTGAVDSGGDSTVDNGTTDNGTGTNPDGEGPQETTDTQAPPKCASGMMASTLVSGAMLLVVQARRRRIRR